METWGRVGQIPSVHVVKAILKILPRINEDRLLRLPIVHKNLERISHYPDGSDFLRNLLVQVRRNFGRLSRNCVARFAGNLIFNEFIAARPNRKEFFTRHGFHPPYFLVISPTMRCNSDCYGCYAGGYDKGEELNTDEIHRLLEEARAKDGKRKQIPAALFYCYR